MIAREIVTSEDFICIYNDKILLDFNDFMEL
jgi:hypothetical protein